MSSLGILSLSARPGVSPALAPDKGIRGSKPYHETRSNVMSCASFCTNDFFWTMTVGDATGMMATAASAESGATPVPTVSH